MANPLTNGEKVSMRIFIWFAGLMIILLGIVLMRADGAYGQAQEVKEEVNNIKIDIGIMRNDIRWIRGEMEEDNKREALIEKVYGTQIN